MLQSVLHPRPNLHQLVPVNQQLPQVALLRARRPQARKPAFQQQLQNVPRIALVGLLLAHITGTNLCRIPHPYLMTQPLQQLKEPLAVTARLDPYQRRNLQPAIEPLRLAIAVDQLSLRHLAGLRIENRDLLPTGMEIASYNFH